VKIRAVDKQYAKYGNFTALGVAHKLPNDAG
jgi:hypothetical protein